MATIYDVPINELIERVAQELSSTGAVTPPPWAQFVKTGCNRERPPTRDDWWQVRAAAVLRKISCQGPIGVSKLRRHYGGKRNVGMAPERVFKGSGAIIRKILQQLDKAGLTRHTKIGIHSGRIITPKGISVLDKKATQLAKDLGITIKPSPRQETPPPSTQGPANESDLSNELETTAQTTQDLAPEKKAAKK